MLTSPAVVTLLNNQLTTWLAVPSKKTLAFWPATVVVTLAAGPSMVAVAVASGGTVVTWTLSEPVLVA